MYKVLFGYAPQKDDELELIDGDYVCVSTSDQGQTGQSVCVEFVYIYGVCVCEVRVNVCVCVCEVRVDV